MIKHFALNAQGSFLSLASFIRVEYLWEHLQTTLPAPRDNTSWIGLLHGHLPVQETTRVMFAHSLCGIYATYLNVVVGLPRCKSSIGTAVPSTYLNP